MFFQEMRPRKKDENSDGDFPSEDWFAEDDKYFYPVSVRLSHHEERNLIQVGTYLNYMIFRI